MRESRSADVQHNKIDPSRVAAEDVLGALRHLARSHRALTGIVVRGPQLADTIRCFDHPAFNVPDSWQRITADPEG